MLKYVQLKPGSVWFHGSANRNPKHVPPCSFFSKYLSGAERFIYVPGEKFSIAKSYITATLINKPRLLHVGRGQGKTRRSLQELASGIYEPDLATAFCAARDQFPGVDGWYNDMTAGGILLFEPDKFMRYGAVKQFSPTKVAQWKELQRMYGE